MNPRTTLAATFLSTLLALPCAALPVPIDSSLEGAPSSFGGTLSYADAMALGMAGAGAGAGAGAVGATAAAAAARALAAGTSCAVPGQASCASVSATNTSGETMLADGSTLVVTASGAQICPAPLGAGIAGPPAPCTPCGKECQERLADELKKEELAKKKKAEEEEAKKIAEKRAQEKKNQDQIVADADRQLYQGKSAGNTQTTSTSNPGSDEGNTLINAMRGGYTGGTSDLVSNNNNNPSRSGNTDGGNGGMALTPNLNQPISPSETVIGDDGRPESLSVITDRAASSVVTVLTQLSQGNTATYGSPTTVSLGTTGTVATRKPPINGPYKSGKCVNTFASLCESEADINGVFQNVLPHMTDDKGDGAVNPGSLKRGTNAFSTRKDG